MRTRRVLILSFYFRPDLSAGSFRTTALVNALASRSADNLQIDVITTLPNRYSTFSRDAAELEERGTVRIRRIRIPPHRSDMLGQAFGFAHFAREALRLVRADRYDLVFATSSRLMTAALGAWVARRKRAPLYLDIRDIFVETLADVLPSYYAPPVRVFFSAIEAWTIRRANRVNLVSRGFEPYFTARYPRHNFSWFPNGIDDEFLACSPGPDGASVQTSRAIRTILYAGNLGESQALHAIVPQLALALEGRAHFVIIGDGGRKELLKGEVERAGASNVELRDPVPRSELLKAYAAADVLFLHLGKQPAFERVLPSKLFEYAALGKPILAGVSGYCARFIRDEVSNAAVFEPGAVHQAAGAFEQLRLVDTPRTAFVEKFRRASIAPTMAADVVGVLGSARADITDTLA